MPVNVILTWAVSDVMPAAPLPEGYAAHRVSDVADVRFAQLDGFYSRHGFPAGWSARLLAHSGRATIVVDADGQVGAAAWLFREPFYVDEIRRSFRPDRDADYYFGDFVAPAHRGRGLQRALIALRVARSQADGRQWAVAMTRLDNPVSLANYAAAGFREAGRISMKTLGPVQIDRILTEPTGLHGAISGEGIGVGAGFRLRRGR